MQACLQENLLSFGIHIIQYQNHKSPVAPALEFIISDTISPVRHQREYLDCKRGRANKTGLFGAGATNDEAKYNTTCIKFVLRKKVFSFSS